MSARRAILILGMHRSGTSALTRVLNLCGAAIPDDVLPPNAANETGYWEPTAVVSLHDELLARAGSVWTDPFEFPPEWFQFEAGEAYVDRLAAVVRNEFGDSPLIAIKDPRACRLVPLWLRVFDRLSIEPLVVLMVRHPLEVAASLERRDGLETPAALLLWLQHVLAAEEATRACRRVFVSYGQLLDAWPAVIDRIEQQLGVPLPEPRYAGTPAAEAVTQFLTPSLRHSRLSRAELDNHPAVTPLVRTVYDWHLRAIDDASAVDPAVIDRVRGELRNLEAAWVPHVREQHRRLVEAGETRAKVLDERIAALDADLADRDRRITGLLADRKETEERWQARQAQWNARERTLEASLAEVTQRACDLHDMKLAMERSPFWRLRTWLRRQQSRLTRSAVR